MEIVEAALHDSDSEVVEVDNFETVHIDLQPELDGSNSDTISVTQSSSPVPNSVEEISSMILHLVV